MITDDERRDVARRLRSFVTDDSVYADVDACRVLHSIGLYYKDIDRIYFSGFDVARLADLIDPPYPDATASYKGWRAEVYDPDGALASPSNVAADLVRAHADGKMRHSTKEEQNAYSAMLEKMSVELHPVDRDALLALAEDVDEAAAMAVVADASKGARMLADMLLDIARRIREACGEVVR